MLDATGAAGGEEIAEADERLNRLRGVIRSIERRPPRLGSQPCPSSGDEETSTAAPAPCAAGGAWTLGDAALDGIIGGGLDPAALHEIKPAEGFDWSSATAAARRFALELALRRLDTAPARLGEAPILWCGSERQGAEAGRLHAPGLAALGLPLERIVLIEAARQADALWAIEECLKSRTAVLVVGEVADVGLTPARRLALAAAAASTPCLLVTAARAGPAAATASRWRIAPAASGSNLLDPHAPGASRCRAVLERCRGSVHSLQSLALILEYSDVASGVRMVSGLPDRQAGPRPREVRRGFAVASG